MGKQTRFFITERDELLLFEKIAELGHSILDTKGNRLSTKDAIASEKSQLYFYLSCGSIIKSKSGFVDDYSSETIQFSRCGRRVKNTIEAGRIWAEIKYWKAQDEFVAKSPRFIEMYDYLAKWIKKNMRLSINKAFYISEEAYRLYKENSWVMLAPANEIVDFK